MATVTTSQIRETFKDVATERIQDRLHMLLGDLKRGTYNGRAINDETREQMQLWVKAANEELHERNGS